MFPFKVKCDNLLNNMVRAAKTVSIMVKCDLVLNNVFYLIEHEGKQHKQQLKTGGMQVIKVIGQAT